MRLRVDELPLEAFDSITRFAVFWLRAKGRGEVAKGEARFFSQADELRLANLRERILAESKAGFRLRLDDLLRLLIRVSAWTRTARCVGCTFDGDQNKEGELDT